MTGIVILNWNGETDTIECLKSLYAINDSEFFIILVDNGSRKESIDIISSFINSYEGIESYHISMNDYTKLPRNLANKSTVLYELDDNYGFAKGNNRGLELAKRFNPEFLMMLNNDTEVEPDFLSVLVNFNKEHPEFVALCPKISLYYDKSKIWNCGGNIWWGFRKYHYGGKLESSIKEKDFIRASFVTGCAFFFKTSLIENEPLLTERFFHGEEDFELAYRFKHQGYKMACVLKSHIYHKVGRASKGMNNLGNIYCYYLQRFINMRHQMNFISYKLWKTFYLIYIWLLFTKKGLNPIGTIKFCKKLIYHSSRIDKVDKATFISLLREGI
ncbi:MAG: glycosyltransferase family 2 protein [Muribaculaceae bacterium]|nr:glycosyltransferase family 2 protein [Muribaculaceae bacterium]